MSQNEKPMFPGEIAGLAVRQEAEIESLRAANDRLCHDDGALDALHASVYGPTGKPVPVGRAYPQAARMLDALDHAGWTLVRKTKQKRDNEGGSL